MGLSANLAGIRLEHPLMNSAGTCKLMHDVEALCRSAAAAVMVGSMTVPSRETNPGDTYYPGWEYALNSLGLPNPGMPYYEEHLPAMVDLAHAKGKFLFASAAGFTPEEYVALAVMAFRGGADLVEFNWGCPNVWDGGRQKRIACFDSAYVIRILRAAEEALSADALVAVKVSPFSDPFELERVMRVISEFEIVKAVTAVNTFPNALAFAPEGKPRITPAGGLAGMSGPALKPIALGQVKQIRALLPERIQIIGVGGISQWADVQDYHRAGADAVQIGTAFLREGPHIFSRLLMNADNGFER